MCAARFTQASQLVQSASRLQYTSGMLLDGVGVECVHGASCPHGSHRPLVGVFVDTLVGTVCLHVAGTRAMQMQGARWLHSGLERWRHLQRSHNGSSRWQAPCGGVHALQGHMVQRPQWQPTTKAVFCTSVRVVLGCWCCMSLPWCGNRLRGGCQGCGGHSVVEFDSSAGASSAPPCCCAVAAGLLPWCTCLGS
jgi:hypothetical protein